MTDLEITKLCAEAMGWRPAGERKDFDTVKAIPVEQFPGAPHYQYAPLRQDAAAMAFMKMFDMTVETDDAQRLGTTPTRWAVTIFVARVGRKGHDTYVVRKSPDLNRAICECVAKMQIESHH